MLAKLGVSIHGFGGAQVERKVGRFTRRLPATLVEPSIYQKVTEIAEKNDRSLGHVVRDALSFYLLSDVSKTNEESEVKLTS